MAAARAIQRMAPSQTLAPNIEPAYASAPRDATAGCRDARLTKREIVLTPETDAVLNQLVDIFRQATGTRLSTSHVIRAMLVATQGTTDALREKLGQIGSVRLPSNAGGREAERGRFEMLLASAFTAAMRQARPVKPPA